MFILSVCDIKLVKNSLKKDLAHNYGTKLICKNEAKIFMKPENTLINLYLTRRCHRRVDSAVPDSVQLWHRTGPGQRTAYTGQAPDRVQLWHRTGPGQLTVQLWHRTVADSAQLWLGQCWVKERKNDVFVRLDQFV